MMKYRVQVEREFAEVPRIQGNPGQIQQVLLNLMVNARQAMDGGGRLVIRLAAAPNGQGVDLTVRDTGCGMTPEVMRRMFEPNFSTKAGPDETGKGGSGLGLAACLEIIEGHRGRVRVESTPGTWIETALDEPVLLRTGTTYRNAAWGSGTFYYGTSAVPYGFAHGSVLAGCYAQGDAFPASAAAMPIAAGIRNTHRRRRAIPTASPSICRTSWRGSWSYSFTRRLPWVPRRLPPPQPIATVVARPLAAGSIDAPHPAPPGQPPPEPSLPARTAPSNPR